MKTNTGPWRGQVSLSSGGSFWKCRAVHEADNIVVRGNCDYQLHENLFWARRCAKKTARSLNRKKTTTPQKQGWFDA